MIKKLILLLSLCFLVPFVCFGVLSSYWTLDAPQGDVIYGPVSLKTSTAATCTLTIPAHTLIVGDRIAVALNPADPIFDGQRPGVTFTVTGVTGTTVSYANASTLVVAPTVPAGGTVTGPLWLTTGSENRGLAFNDATGHILVAAGNLPKIKIINWDGTVGLDLPKNAQVTFKSRSGNVATLETSVAHELAVGQYAVVALNPTDATFEGTFVITGVTTIAPYTISYTNAGADVLVPVATGGTINNLSGGTLALDKIKAVKGAIYGCSLTAGTKSGTDVLKIYRWASETAAPAVIYYNNAVGGAAVTGPIGPQMTQTFPTPDNVSFKALTTNVATLTTGTTHSWVVGDSVVVALPTALTATRSRSGNFATLTTQAANEFAVNEQIIVTGVGGTGYNATAIVTTVGASSVTYANTGSDEGSTADTGGTITSGFNGTYPVIAPVTANTLSYAKTATTLSTTVSTGTISGNTTLDRLGDTMDVVADDTIPANVQIYIGQACQTGAGRIRSVYRFNYTDGAGVISTIDEITLANVVSAYSILSSGSVTVDGYNGRIYRLANVAGETASWANNGSGKLAAPVGGIRYPVGGAQIGTIGGNKVLLFGDDTSYTGAPTRGYLRGGAVLIDPDPAKNISRATYIDLGPNKTPPTFANTNGTSETEFDNQGDRAGSVFILTTANKLGRYLVPSTGTSKVFTGSGSDWFTAGDWTPTGVPCGLDDVEIPTGKSLRIGGYAAAVCKTLTIRSGATVEVSSVGQPGYWAEETTGYGRNDITVAGSFALPTLNTGNLNPRFLITMASTSTFGWNNNAAANPSTDADYRESEINVPIVGGAMPLTQGITVTFGALTGYTTGNIFQFRLVGNDEALFIAGDRDDSTSDLIVEGTLKNFSNQYVPSNVINNLAGGNKTIIRTGGGTYEHGTNASFATPFPSILVVPTPDGATTFEDGSVYIFNIQGGLTPTLSNRTYGYFILRNSYYDNMKALACAYPGSGGSPLTFLNDLIVERGCTFAPLMTGTVEFRGNIVNSSCSGVAETAQPVAIGSTTLGCTPVFNGTTTVTDNVASSVRLYIASTKNATVNAGKSLKQGSARNLDFGVGDAGPATININGTAELEDNCGFSNISSPKLINLNLNSGASLKTAWISADAVRDPFNLGGGFALGGTLTFDTVATYIFNSSAGAQYTGSMPITAAGLTADNSSGSGVYLSGPVNVTNQLGLINGELITGANNLIIPDGGSAYNQVGGYVVGTLTRVIDPTVTGTRGFPIGTPGKYRPVVVDITSAGSAGTGFVSANSTDGDHPNSPNPADTINRYWTLTESGISGYTADIWFIYDDSDLGGADETTFIGGSWDGLAWQWFSGSSSQRDTLANILKVIGTTHMSDWTLCEEATPVLDWMMH